LSSEHSVREYLEHRENIRRLVAVAAAILEDRGLPDDRKQMAKVIVCMYQPEPEATANDLFGWSEGE
jgi:hypothetical protein